MSRSDQTIQQVKNFVDRIEEGTVQFMADYQDQDAGISARISGEAAAMIVAERSQISAALRSILAGE